MFTNCFTSAPDTPRSLSILFSGLNPRQSGMDSRSKWPGGQLALSDDTFFSIAIANRVRISIVDASLEHSSMLFPDSVKEAATFFPTVESLANETKNQVAIAGSRHLVFVVDKTYHQTVDLLSGHKSAAKKGETAVEKNFVNCLRQLGIGVGDSVFLLSDHGCKLSDDLVDTLSVMNRDRSQIFFYYTDFTSDVLQKFDSLYAMNDVHDTIRSAVESMISEENGVLGPLSPRARELVHVEDHDSFDTRIGEPVRKWAVFSSKYEYYEALGEAPRYISLRTPEDREHHILEAQGYLESAASNYAEMHRQLAAFQSVEPNFTKTKVSFWESRVEKRDFRHSKLDDLRKVYWRLAALPVALRRYLARKLSTNKIRSLPSLVRLGSGRRLLR